MAWYEAHQTLAKHPKTLKLARLLKADRRYTVGLLHDLFSWGLDSAGKDGSLPGLTAEDIAAALDFPPRKGVAVVNALVECGYLDKDGETLAIHDWYDYAGKFMEKRESDRERKRAGSSRKLPGKPPISPSVSEEFPAEIQRKSIGNPLVTVPNLTVPDHSIPSESNTHTPSTEERVRHEDDGFVKFWDAFPGRKSGNIDQAYREYLRALESGVTPETLLNALECQRRQPAWMEENGRYCPSPEKWLRNRGWTAQLPENPQTTTTGGTMPYGAGNHRNNSGVNRVSDETGRTPSGGWTPRNALDD